MAFRGYISSTTSRDFFTVSPVRHIIELTSYTGSFPGYISARGMFGLVGTLDSRFMVAGRWLRGGRTAPGPGTVLCYEVSPFGDLPVALGPSYHLIPVHFLHSAIMAGYYSMHLFPVALFVSGFCKFYFVTSVLLHMYFVMQMCWFVCSSLMLRILVCCH